ncbi:MAG: GDP-L-fucose synthase [Bryobacteraceae bacterium]
MPARLNSGSRIYVAGHRGLVGAAIKRRLEELGCRNILARTKAELDLRDGAAVDHFFASEKPEYVFLAAAKVGGIMANALEPAVFLYENLAIQTNVIHSAWKHGASKLLFLGSSCIYPKMAPQPIQESSLLTGPLEETNEAYAIAKIAGLKMAAAYRAQYGFQAISLMPTNLYGPGDNFDLETSHVLPALIRRFHEAVATKAKEVVLWGTGTPRREFLHVTDLAAAACFSMEHYDGTQHLNVGTGEDLTIAELAQVVAKVTRYQGKITFDSTKPDGTPRKVLDVSKIRRLGWVPRISLEDGIVSTYEWYVTHKAKSMAG